MILKYQEFLKYTNNSKKFVKIKLNPMVKHNTKDYYAGLNIYVDGTPGCKWWFKIEFEGDEIEIG